MLSGQHPGKVGLFHEAELDQIVAYPGSVISLLLKSFIELVLGNQPFFQEKVADPRRICGRSCQELVSLRWGFLGAFGSSERLGMAVFLGRGSSEKVTLVSSFPTMEGPMPFTRSKPALDPNGPKESRSATIRRASAGPMCLKDSISSAVATSRSTGPGRGGGGFFFPRRLGVRPAFLAESAAFIWDSRAAREIGRAQV